MHSVVLVVSCAANEIFFYNLNSDTAPVPFQVWKTTLYCVCSEMRVCVYFVFCVLYFVFCVLCFVFCVLDFFFLFVYLSVCLVTCVWSVV